MPIKNFLSFYGAAAWSVIFGALHALWASGYYILLPAEQASQAFKRDSFYIYNLVVVGICIIGILLALIQSNIISAQISSRAIKFLGYSVVVLLALRGLAGLAQALYLAVVHDKNVSLMTLWDIWFCIGAFLYFLNTRPRRG